MEQGGTQWERYKAEMLVMWDAAEEKEAHRDPETYLGLCTQVGFGPKVRRVP